MYFGAGHISTFAKTVKDIALVADALRIHRGGGIFFAHEFTMLVYPKHNPAWSFIDLIFPPDQLKSDLRFIMSVPRPDLASQTLPKLIPKAMESKADAAALFLQYFGIHYDKLISQGKKKEGTTEVFFLMYTPAIQEESDILVRFLHSQGAKVTTGMKGEWNNFLRHETNGIVLVLNVHRTHPDELTFPQIHDSIQNIHKIPYLSHVLQKNASIFIINLKTSLQHGITRLFPHGSAILLTDSIFLHHPARALQILTWFRLSVLESKPAWTWKVVTRPRIRDWILSLMAAKPKSESTVYLGIYEQIWRLLPLELMDRAADADFETPGPDAPFVSAAHIDGYDLGVGLHDLAPDARPGLAANDAHLVRWYAAWSMGKTDRFRRFHVIYAGDELGEEAAKKEWSALCSYVSFQVPACTRL
jgi:chromo domain-containing protein 1